MGHKTSLFKDQFSKKQFVITGNTHCLTVSHTIEINDNEINTKEITRMIITTYKKIN